MSPCRCGHKKAQHAQHGSCFWCGCDGYKPEDGPYRQELSAWERSVEATRRIVEAAKAKRAKEQTR